MNTKTKILLFLIASLMITLSLVIPPSHAGDVQVKDGEDVMVTISGKIYIGHGVSINGPFITLFNIRYPETMGTLTIPAEQLTMVYHKGQIQQQ